MKRLTLYILLLLVMPLGRLCAQDNCDVAMLLNGFKSATSDSAKLGYCLRIAENTSNSDTALFFAQQGIKLALQLNDSLMLEHCYGSVGWAEFAKSNYQSALQNYIHEYHIAVKLNDSQIKGRTLLDIAGCYYSMGDMSMSLGFYKKAIKFFTEISDSLNIAEVYRQIGGNCSVLEMYDLALNNFHQAMDIDFKIKNNLNLSKDYGYIARTLLLDYETVEKNTDIVKLRKSEIYADSVPKLLSGLPDSYDKTGVMAEYYYTKTKICLDYFNQNLGSYYIDSAKVFHSKYESFALNTMNQVALLKSDLLKVRILLDCGKTDKAITLAYHLKDRVSVENCTQSTCKVYKILAEAFAQNGDYPSAFANYQIFVQCLQKLVNANAVMSNAEFRVGVRSEERIDELINAQDEELAIKTEKINSQRKINMLAMTVLVIVFVVALVMLFLWRKNRKIVKLLNYKNSQLSSQQEEIISQKKVIDEQKTAVEKANIEMYQSISYAKHIQQAALPSEDYVRKIFPDSFVFYQPKDIVSGDWYYVTQNSGYNIFVLADCTGHGVPGGFLSMLGISAIKELLKNPEIDIEPGIILDLMRNYIKSVLSNDIFIKIPDSDDESYSTADGMDMTICAIAPDAHKLRFAAAYQSLYIVRQGHITRLKGDRMPVGRHIKEKPNFTTQTFDLQKDDMIYLCSDGIESQIGFTGTKFMTKRLKEFFINNYDKPCVDQNDNIRRIMEDWMFGVIQVDDLSLVGIRIE